MLAASLELLQLSIASEDLKISKSTEIVIFRNTIVVVSLKRGVVNIISSCLHGT